MQLTNKSFQKLRLFKSELQPDFDVPTVKITHILQIYVLKHFDHIAKVGRITRVYHLQYVKGTTKIKRYTGSMHNSNSSCIALSIKHFLLKTVSKGYCKDVEKHFKTIRSLIDTKRFGEIELRKILLARFELVNGLTAEVAQRCKGW